MSWQGYVPKEVWRLFGDNPAMANILYKYSILAKHAVDNEEIVFLFKKIADLKRFLELNEIHLNEQNAEIRELKANLLEVTGNYAIQGKKLELAIEALISSRQFCTWLCEDSRKYQGTDAAHAARSKQIEIGKCLDKLK